MEFQNKCEENQPQQGIISSNEQGGESITKELKIQNTVNREQYHRQILTKSPSIWQLSIVILLVVAVLTLGLYSYVRLNSNYQQYDEAINQRMDQVKAIFEKQTSNLQYKLQNSTMKQLDQDIYFNETTSKITKQHDQIYGSIKSILSIARQIENYKESNSRNFESMIREIEEIDELKRQIQHYYTPTKVSPYLPIFKKIVSDGGPSISNKEEFFEKVVWLFVDSIQSDQSYANSLYYRNIKYFSEKSGFQVKLVTMNNYLYYLSPEKVNLLTNMFTMLKTVIREDYGKTNLNDHFQNIAKVLILMHILEQHGGIIIKDYQILLEPLDWIYNITEYEFVNKGNGNTSPKVIAFFDTEYSSIKRIQKKGETSDQIPMYKFPSIEQNFIMAVKNSELITLINQQMIRILSNATAIKDEIQMQKYEMNNIKGQDPYYEFFFIANHIVLQVKQRELDQWVYLGAGDYPTKFALDYYGLYTINRYYGPYKLKIFLENKDESLMFKYLAKLSINQLEDKIGKIQFVAQMKFSKNLQYKLKQIKQKNTIEVMKNSFIEKMLFSKEDPSNIQFYDNEDTVLDYPIMQIKSKWLQLPRIIWIYSSSYINDDLKVIEEKCINRIKYLAEKSNFIVNVVTEDIANMYLSSDMIDKINLKLSKSQYPEYFRLKQMIIILAILSKYGGVYMDSSFIALQNFDWIVNIPSMNPKYINNRFGEVPNVLLFTNPWFSQNFNWTLNKQSRTRNKTDVVYDYGFIAAKKESKIIIEYLEQLLRFIKMQFQNIQAQLLKCGVQNPISKDNRPDLLPHDSFTCAVKKGIKMAQIKKKQFNDQYNVWSIDGETNIFKFNAANNYQNVHKNQNLFLASYSQEYVKKIVGKFDKLIKLEEDNLAYLNTKIKNYELDSNGKINNQSIINKYLLSQVQ